MALKDWKKISKAWDESYEGWSLDKWIHKKSDEIISIEKSKEDSNLFYYVKYGKGENEIAFDKRMKALNFIRKYMRTH